MRLRTKLVKRRKFMSDEDRYTVAEFARRYKISEANLEAFCARFNLVPETVVTREEFKRMLDEYQEGSSPAEEESTNQGSAPELEAERPEEENVSEEKRTFSRWVKQYKEKYRLSNPKLVYLRRRSGIKDEDEITEQEFLSQVNRHLFNKQ
jgi:hypothetical protein